ncbi:endonuclease/exonuclease/phosphatase family protein [Virgibacillus ndiopensis]|uniref:endonuclease/exonuclease/phosphatase family protein n=1 Tax=Virgibacillus ndiopensis TaxID=2004408 RepID=UPI001FE417EB|nr:endonuclease/exonuclease/phosphatase family protein [Virgibacillus ndiopensis]
MKKGIVFLMFFLVLSSLNTVFAEKNETVVWDSGEVTARVATYNMHAGIGVDGKYDLDRIASAIRDMDADIIGLQEVDVHWGSRSQYDNTVQLLAEKLDMEYFFAPIYDLEPAEEGDPRRQYGIAVLSKYPILSAANRNITRLSTQDPNPEPKLAPGFLEAQVNMEGAHVWFYVTHLDYRSDPTIREMQVQDMLHVMAEHQYNVLVGDMNATPDSDELRPLFHLLDDTWNSKTMDEGYTFPADSPIKRIDYVLTSPRMDVNDVSVHQSLASDHLPVIADVTFVRGNHSMDTDGMKMLVEAFLENGEIGNEEAAHALRIHLQAVSYYENNDRKEKVIKHLGTFIQLLQKQSDQESITDHALTTLRSDAEYLIEKWEYK